MLNHIIKPIVANIVEEFSLIFRESNLLSKS